MVWAPRPPDGLTADELLVWCRHVWEPWAEREVLRARRRELHGRRTGVDRRRAEQRAAVLQEFADYVAAQEAAGARRFTPTS
jgi:hypothetical protein